LIDILYLSDMAKKEDLGLDFHIDKLTNSIENVISGDSFETIVSVLTKSDLVLINKTLKWSFDWREEYKQPTREVFKLTIYGNPTIIQGLISLEIKKDHVFIHLLENAPFNIGKSKIYAGVAGNLVAFACKFSFQRGFDGVVSFVAKSKLIEHYKESLGAFHIGNQIMVIENQEALKLIGKYFKN
jgi:hypothetical protein